MNRKEVIETLKKDLLTNKVLMEIEKNTANRKVLKEKVQAYEFAINEIEGSTPKVKIQEFLDNNKNWRIIVTVNGSLINDENVEFISERRTAQEVPIQEQPLVINLSVVKDFDYQSLINQLDNSHKFDHRR